MAHKEVPSVAVVGLGTMGGGIARLLIKHGYHVRGFDPVAIPHSLQSLESEGRFSGEGSIEACVRNSQFVFEAVPEMLDLKLDVLRQISMATDGVIASNTSTFIPSALALSVVDPARFLVAHFFNPADLIPLVEVVPTSSTDPSVVSRTIDVLTGLGKVPVHVEREVAGFIANRLQAAVLREAISLVEAGVATPEAVDSAMVNGIGPRWAVAGPLRVADLGGLDVWARVCAQIFPTLDRSDTPQALLEHAVELGHLGAKSGQGIYVHTPENTSATFDAMAAVFAAKSS